MQIRINGAVSHCRGIYQIRDVDLEYWSNILSQFELIGVGIAGTLVASSIAAYQEKSASFVRLNQKEHGLPSIWDGKLPSSHAKLAIFCSGSDECYAVEWLRKCEAADKLGSIIVVVEVANVLQIDRDVLSPWTGRLASSRTLGTIKDIDQYFPRLSGRTFRLSSGLLSEVYIETLPAAYTFDLVNEAVESRATRFRDAHFVGIAYGGIYLAVVANIKNGFRPLCVDPGAFSEAVAFDPGRIVLIDDFVSTGNSFSKAERFFPDSDVEKISLSAKVNLLKDDVEVIFRI
jgi:orotate phosphoribosyltransferase